MADALDELLGWFEILEQFRGWFQERMERGEARQDLTRGEHLTLELFVSWLYNHYEVPENREAADV